MILLSTGLTEYASVLLYDYFCSVLVSHPPPKKLFPLMWIPVKVLHFMVSAVQCSAVLHMHLIIMCEFERGGAKKPIIGSS